MATGSPGSAIRFGEALLPLGRTAGEFKMGGEFNNCERRSSAAAEAQRPASFSPLLLCYCRSHLKSKSALSLHTFQTTAD
jgi:hypothetical protein